MAKVISIFNRLGTGGGGKIKAVYARMNMLSEVEGHQPILLVMEHNPKFREIFLELQSTGAIRPGVAMFSLPEYLGLHAPSNIAAAKLPAYDETSEKKGQKVYLLGGKQVMLDKYKATTQGMVTRRSYTVGADSTTIVLIDDVPFQKTTQGADGVVETTDFGGGVPVRSFRLKGNEYLGGRNLLSRKFYRTRRALEVSLFQMIPWDDSLAFFDGITSAYLAQAINGPRALFLHADHRAPDGSIVGRSQDLIEKFPGEAIITATEVHKQQMLADLIPAAEIHVIPHICEVPRFDPVPRRNIVTVSRLELAGKPIHECIDAFSKVADEFPEVDYLIYGDGAGHAQLQDRIGQLGMAGRVRLMGYTQKPLEVFQGALASIYPTLTEGFGLSILEALSCGCPVLSYDVNYGPREMIDPGRNGELVPAGRIDEIAAAMRTIIRNAKTYGEGTPHRLDRYSARAYRQNYLQVIDRLMDLRQPVAPIG